MGDHIIFPNGDLRAVASRSGTTVTCGGVLASFKGPQGNPGDKGEPGDPGKKGDKGDPGDSRVSLEKRTFNAARSSSLDRLFVLTAGGNGGGAMITTAYASSSSGRGIVCGNNLTAYVLFGDGIGLKVTASSITAIGGFNANQSISFWQVHIAE